MPRRPKPPVTPTLPFPASDPGPAASNLVLYQTEDGATRVQVRLHEGTVWMTQRTMAELYETSKQGISAHIQGIFEDREVRPEATVKNFLTVQQEGERQVNRAVEHYSLPVILAVGYRVRSTRGTQFRRWATTQLEDLLVKGFVLDDARLKDGRAIGADAYFDELLERIRDIRASERIFYQKITDIYAQCSVDYDSAADVTKRFYATVQNKLHWAIHGHTAAELIRDRAHAEQPNMGLKTWKNAPHGKIRKGDVNVAKNYLDEAELRELNRVVTMYLDFAEDQAQRKSAMTMMQWEARLDAFLAFNERAVLKHSGQVSANVARVLAETELDRYETRLRGIEAEQPSSDFDRLLQRARHLTRKA